MKVRTEERRSAILDAAAELFMEFGYERASMNELAARLGGSKATLYGYFPSKEALFSAVVRQSASLHLMEATQSLRAGAEDRTGFETVLRTFAGRMLQVLTNDRDALAIYRMVIAEAGRSAVGELFHESGPSESIAALTARMKEGAERGWLRPGEPRIYALQFTALATAEVNGRVYLRDPAPVVPPEIDAMAGRAVEMFLSGAAMR